MARNPIIRRHVGLLGAGQADALRLIEEQTQELAKKVNTDVTGRIQATAGHKILLGEFTAVNLAASATTTLQLGSSTVAADFPALRSGNVTGLIFSASEAAAGSVLQVDLLIDGTSVTNRKLAVGESILTEEFNRDVGDFGRQSTIGVSVTTDASWTATTMDVKAWLEVEM